MKLKEISTDHLWHNFVSTMANFAEWLSTLSPISIVLLGALVGFIMFAAEYGVGLFVKKYFPEEEENPALGATKSADIPSYLDYCRKCLFVGAVINLKQSNTIISRIVVRYLNYNALFVLRTQNMSKQEFTGLAVN